MEEPMSGSQMAYYEADGQEELEIDMAAGSNHGLESLWYQYRGGGGPTGFVQLDFYAPDDSTLLGSHTVSTSDDGGASIGLDAAFAPEFDLITVPAALASQAMATRDDSLIDRFDQGVFNLPYPKKYWSPKNRELSTTIAGATDSLVIGLTWDGGKPFSERINGRPAKPESDMARIAFEGPPEGESASEAGETEK